jgi:hypothetical protein
MMTRMYLIEVISRKGKIIIIVFKVGITERELKLIDKKLDIKN